MTSQEHMASRPHQRKNPLTFIAILVGILLTLGVAGRIWQRQVNADLARPSSDLRNVIVETAVPAPPTVDITLPGTVLPVRATELYARTDGFVRTLKVDIGDEVHEGQLLALIDTPEVVDQLRTEEAHLGEAEDNIGLIQANSERSTQLAREGALTPQSAEDAQARYNTARAAVAASKAEVKRLRTLVRYQQVQAPFDGTITRRWIQTGALVTEGTTRLFDIASTNDLKVQVEVPQFLAESVKPGSMASVQAHDRAAEPVSAPVQRTSGALDRTTRTLLVEIRLPEGDRFLAGSYVNVRFVVPRAGEVSIVPASALSITAKGVHIAVVDSNDRVHIRNLVIGRDLGRDVEVLSGIRPGERAVLYPPTDLADLEQVHAIARKKQSKPGARS